jgi:hypothetical protein
MRCEECGRSMLNTELWKLGSDPKAPTARSMRTLCWDCRAAEQGDRGQQQPPPTEPVDAPREALEIVSLL